MSKSKDRGANTGKGRTCMSSSSDFQLNIKITLNHEQKEAYRVIEDNDITFLMGAAGSGKTLLAAYYALDNLINKNIKRIIITRPTVSKEEIGFLPGNIREKLDPWVQPVFQNMYTCIGSKDRVSKLIESTKIELLPVAYIRGWSFVDSVVIVDEAQNITNHQMKMILSRISTGSKIIVCGDITQSDLPAKEMNGLGFVKRLKEIIGVGVYELKYNNRLPIVTDILNAYDELDNSS